MSPRLQFLRTVFLGLLMIIATIGIITLVVEMGGGLFWGIVSGVSFGLGGLLAYHTTVDRVNLRIIRRSLIDQADHRREGDATAFSGVVRVEGDPLISPFTQKECAAYTYTISVSRPSRSNRRTGSSRHVLAEGFYMLPTSLASPSGSVKLAALPSVESDLRTSENGEWPNRVRNKLKSLIDVAPRANERQRAEALLAARKRVDGPVQQDYCQIAELGEGRVFTVEEEVVPANTEVCAVGTYDPMQRELHGEKDRFGPDLIVYEGNPQEVLERVGRDVALYTKIALGLIGASAAIVGYVLVSLG